MGVLRIKWEALLETRRPRRGGRAAGTRLPPWWSLILLLLKSVPLVRGWGSMVSVVGGLLLRCLAMLTVKLLYRELFGYQPTIS